mgnify:CR=1 FL=1
MADLVGKVWDVALIYVGTPSAADDLVQYMVPCDVRVLAAQASAETSSTGVVSIENKTDSVDIVATIAIISAALPIEGTLTTTVASQVLTDGEIISLNVDTAGDMVDPKAHVLLVGI